MISLITLIWRQPILYNIPDGSDIRTLRLKAKLTQTELAKRAKVSQSLIARI